MKTIFDISEARKLRESCNQPASRAEAIRIALQYLADADAGPDVLMLVEGVRPILEEIAAMDV